MTIIVKGFVTVNDYVNNVPGRTSAICELSTWSRTYSKEKGEYLNDTLPGYRLTTFKTVDTQTGNETVVPVNLAKHIMLMVYESITYAKAHIRPYDPNDFRNSIVTTFFQKISNLQFGNFVDNGQIALPEWVSWTSLENANAQVKIWLSDLAFQDQYDESQIVVIPPIETVDHFFNQYNVALTEIKSRTLQELSDTIQLAKTDNPETYVRLLEFDFYNILNVEQKNKCTWAVLIYGKVGDNIDSIKDALVDYIISHSTHTKAEWELRLPDIFKRTEFALLPRWDKISIENLTDLSSLYSSILSPTECIQFAKNSISFYQASYVETHVEVFPYDYKALSVVAVPGPTNVVGSQKLYEMFSDYIPVPSTSPDFNRMEIKTRDWALFIEKLLIIAETATEFTSVPYYAHKQYKDGKLYISGMFDNVNYLVAAKSNSFYQ